MAIVFNNLAGNGQRALTLTLITASSLNDLFIGSPVNCPQPRHQRWLIEHKIDKQRDLRHDHFLAVVDRKADLIGVGKQGR